jgi:hypothetical protein
MRDRTQTLQLQPSTGGQLEDRAARLLKLFQHDFAILLGLIGPKHQLTTQKNWA